MTTSSRNSRRRHRHRHRGRTTAQCSTCSCRPTPRGAIQSGLGIGLTLAKTLVELHGGTIEAMSAGVDRGTELVVRIPVVDPPPATPSPQPSDSLTGLETRRVLVVDDNHDSAHSLEILLELSGHEYHPHTTVWKRSAPQRRFCLMSWCSISGCQNSTVTKRPGESVRSPRASVSS